ncbi:hypothetical protein [Chitiniphilus shinanonensis]
MKNLFFALLFLPFVFPLLALLFGLNEFFGVLWMVLYFGGVEYAAFF